MSMVDFQIFLLVFFVVYFVLAVVINFIRYLTKSSSKKYRIAIAIFALLVAAMFTYSNLGRSTLQYYSIPNQQSN